MAKSRSLEEDKNILGKKIKEQSVSSNSESSSSVRSLRKRLKRIQRKMRSLKAREYQASAKPPAEATT